MWGDCGKYPLALELTKQVFCYYKRLQKLELEGSDSLVRHAYNSEQRHLKLAWYNKLTELRQTIQDREKNRVNYPSQMRKSLCTTFCEIWEAERKTNRKLGFYNSIKENYGCETYLNIGLSYKEQKQLAQFKTSSHRYKAETGRYKQKNESVSVVNKICEYCSPNSEVIVNFSALPFFEPIIEDEKHVLFECPQYEKERLQFKKAEKDFKNALTCISRTRGIASFSKKCHNRRFPEDNIAATKKSMENTSRNKKPSRRKKKTTKMNG